MVAEGKSVGHLQAWPRSWTRDYREQIQLAVSAGIEPRASRLQAHPPNCFGIPIYMDDVASCETAP